MEKANAVKKDKTAEFIKLCGNYCAIVEKADKMPIHELIDRAAESLMAIYKHTFMLNRFKTRYESEPQKYLTEKQYNKIIGALVENLGPRDKYPEFLDPTRINNTSLFSSKISEDLTDIYQDIYDFMHWFEEGTFEAINDSQIELMTNFEKYWGIKLLNCLRAMHVIRYLKKDGTIFKDFEEGANADDDDDLPLPDDDEDDDHDPDEFEDIIEEEIR